MTPTRTLYGIALSITVLMLLGAYYFQSVLLLEPCPLCIFQRVAVMGVAVWGLLGVVHATQSWWNGLYALGLTLTSVVGAAIAGRHVYLQQLPADEVPSCGPGLDFMLSHFPLQRTLQMVFSGSGECAEVDWTLLGVSIPGWTLLAFVVLMALGIGILWRQWRGSA